MRLRLPDYEAFRHESSGTTRAEGAEAARLRASLEADLAMVQARGEDAPERIYAGGLLAFARGDFASAAAAFAEYLADAPSDAEALAWRAHALQHAGSLEEAEVEYGRSIACDAHSSASYGNRGLVRLQMGRVELALADLDRAIEIESRRSGSRRAEFWVDRALAHWARGELDRALADLDAALEIAPGQVAALVNRGNVHRARGDRERAIADYSTALDLAPDSYDAWFLRAVTRTETGDRKGAIADLGRAILLRPEDPDPYIQRGSLRSEEKDADGAIADFEAALAIAPDHPAHNVVEGYLRDLRAARGR